MLRIDHLTIIDEKEGRTLVKDLSFLANFGDRIAIIGEEGNGKSVLLKIILGLPLPYIVTEGHIQVDGKTGYLEQDIKGSWGQTDCLDYLLLAEPGGQISPEDFALFAGLDPLLGKLGLRKEALEGQEVGKLSGGETVKLGLVKLLLHQSDCLLLDEPSNDLDLNTIDFLIDFLSSCPLPILFVSHDVGLLRAVSTGVIHLEQTARKKEPISTFASLPYPAYVEERSRKLGHQSQIAKNEAEQFAKKKERWLRIYQAVRYAQDQCVRDPTTGRLLKKKMKTLLSQRDHLGKEEENLTKMPERDPLLNIFFSGDNAIPAHKRILDFSGKIAIGEKVLVEKAELHVIGPEKIAIVGDNGIGKSTFLKMAIPLVAAHEGVRVGYMPQDYDEVLPSQGTPLRFLVIKGDREEETFHRQCLGALLFTSEEMVYPMKRLSGGMKAKLLLLKLVLENDNVLLLDEPTRNLSPLSVPVIEDLLHSFKGMILAVSHDRSFVGNVFTKVYRLSEDGFSLLEP